MAWQQLTSIKGPQGAQGPTGPQGPKGDKGDTGAAGADGAGIEIAGSVATYANLPTGLTAANSGDGYLVNADGKLYIWDGSAFPANGQGVAFQGPVGPQGPKGDTGAQGAQGAQGIQGVKGDTGAQGTQGTAGLRGTQWFTGTGAPGTIAGSAAGDLYLDLATGTVYTLA